MTKCNLLLSLAALLGTSMGVAAQIYYNPDLQPAGQLRNSDCLTEMGCPAGIYNGQGASGPCPCTTTGGTWWHCTTVVPFIFCDNFTHIDLCSGACTTVVEPCSWQHYSCG